MSAAQILVPLDGTQAARAALPVAKALGDAIGASVHLLHVGSVPSSSLANLAGRLGIEQSGLRGWTIGARLGEPAMNILDEARARDIRLIVMCTHTAAIRPLAILGHTALGVLRDAPCPVTLVSPVHDWNEWSPGRILFPYDGSSAANAAVVPAAELARRPGAELLVLQVGATDVAAPADRGALAMPRYVDQPQHEWAHWTHELLERLSCLCPDGELHAHVYVRAGEPAPAILQWATEHRVDLIVLAWKGVWTAGHASTLKAIVRDAPCPVMVVRAS